MAAHRYWRLTVTANSITAYNGYPQVSELRLSATASGPQVAVGGTASADDVAGGNRASYAFDNDPATFWSAATGFPHWLQYDFGTSNAPNIAEFAITARVGADSANAPRDFTLGWSDDGTNFTAVFTATGQMFAAGETKVYTPAVAPAPSSTGKHRFWQINITFNYGGSYTGFQKIMLAEADGVNRALVPGNATANSEFGGQPASNAIAGQTGQWATTGGTTGQWNYDFGAGQAFDIQKVSITARSESNGTVYDPRVFDVRWSDTGNGTDWTTAWSVSDTTSAPSVNEVRNYAVPVQGVAPAPTPAPVGNNYVFSAVIT